MRMTDEDKTYLLKELTRTLDESDSTAAFCLCQRWILKDALALLKEQPEIVRCRDCKHWSPEHEGLCPYNDIFTVPDWFCADGERKDDVRLTEAMADRPY